MNTTLIEADLDVAILHDLVGDDMESVTQILRIYAASMRDCVRDLRDGTVLRDHKRVEAAAHRMKSPSLSVGALPLGRLCRAVEQAARSGDWPKIDLLFPLLDERVDGTLRRVDAKLAAAIR